MNDKDLYELRNNLEFWVQEAHDIVEIIEGKRESITMALEIASKLRDFYLDGKEDGVWEWNNTPR